MAVEARDRQMTTKPRRFRTASSGRSFYLAVAGVSCALLAGGVRVAAAQTVVQRPDEPIGLGLGVGFRTDVLSHRGFDPFSTDDAVTQLALTASQALTQIGATALAVGFEWNRGQVDSEARGVPTSLALDRLLLQVEASRPIRGPLSGIVRAGAGVLTAKARIDDASGPRDAFGGGAGAYATRFWAPSVEASAGLAWRLGTGAAVWRSRLSFWLRGDAGYTFSVARDLTLTTQSEPVLGRTDDPVRLGGLAVRGAFARLQLAVSF